MSVFGGKVANLNGFHTLDVHPKQRAQTLPNVSLVHEGIRRNVLERLHSVSRKVLAKQHWGIATDLFVLKDVREDMLLLSY